MTFCTDDFLKEFTKDQCNHFKQTAQYLKQQEKRLANTLSVSSKTGAAMRIIPGAFGGRPRDTLWSHLMDFTGVFVELELSHEKWLSEELVPILDYRRNFFFPLNSSFLWIMALNVSGIFQFIFRWQVSWDGRGFMLGIILVKYKVGEGERRNACVCVLSSFFESICMTYEVCVVSLGN